MSEKSSRSTLNTAVSSRVQWAQADRSVWPHSSLRRSPSTPAQRESGCCSSCTDRPSPGAQRCSPETCCSRPPSSSGSSLTGSPCWPHTPVAVFFEEISALEGGRTLTLGRVTPDKHTTLSSVKKKAFLSFQVQKNIWTINNVILNLLVILAPLNVQVNWRHFYKACDQQSNASLMKYIEFKSHLQTSMLVAFIKSIKDQIWINNKCRNSLQFLMIAWENWVKKEKVKKKKKKNWKYTFVWHVYYKLITCQILTKIKLSN